MRGGSEPAAVRLRTGRRRVRESRNPRADPFRGCKYHQVAGGFPARLQPRVNRFALEREYAENALVDAPERFLPDEPLQTFDAEREFAEGE